MCKFNLFFGINILITNKNPYMRELLLQTFDFFINYEKTALEIFFFTLQGCSLVVNGETDKILGMVVKVSFP